MAKKSVAPPPPPPSTPPMSSEALLAKIKADRLARKAAQRIQIVPQIKTVAFFKTGDELMEKAREYLAWCDENPVVLQQQSTHKDQVIRYDVEKHRIPSQSGFCQYIGCSVHSFQTWMRGTRSPELQEAAQLAADMFRNCQIELGAAGAVVPVFAVRMAGLAEKQEMNVSTTLPPPSTHDADDIPNLVHPDAPIEDQLSDRPLLFSKHQLEAGVPYPAKVINHKDAAE